MNTKSIISLFTGIAILAGIMLYSSSPDSQKFKSVETRQDQPFMYIEDLNSAIFDVEGKKSGFLTTSRVEQIPGQKNLTLNKPKFTKYNKEDAWQVISESGKLDPQHKIFTLSKNVDINNHVSMIEISTEHLTIDHIQNIAYTEDLVTIKSETSNTTTEGLKLDINEEKLFLEKNVKTTIYPDNN